MAVDLEARIRREAELDALVAQYDADLGPEIVERCAFCDFQIQAPVGEAREAWRAHDCARPRPAPRKQNRGFQIRR